MQSTPEYIAEELRLVVRQLVVRFRQDCEFPLPQFNTLSVLSRMGSRTTSQLAVLEHVRPQSMAHTVKQLLDTALVERRPDPEDGRQMLIDISDSGRSAMDDFRRTADAWVADAISTRLDDDERQTLQSAITLLQRLVDE